ncbi:unnamed protein product [Brachionus calyciflorus]|uniref:Homeobox domain-containing protein n=1 Tax=Brachionus calyciflorus TaxID=104777 RepID=A0A814F2N3_9BILA|nr:unnamed protein product [Brachionus calyciflorus]
MQEIVSSPALLGSSTPIEKESKIDSTTPGYYYSQNEFYYQNPAVAAVLQQHYQNYSNSNFSVNNLVENQEQSVLVNHLHKPILNLNWQTSPALSKNSSPNTNPTNTSSSSDSDYYNMYQEQDKLSFPSDNTVSSSNDFYQQKNIFNPSGFRNFVSQPGFGQSNFYPYDQYQRPYVPMSYNSYSSPNYEDLDVKNSKIVSSSPKIEQSGNQLSSSSSSSFTSSPNSNKTLSTPTTTSSTTQNTSTSSQAQNSIVPESFEWMKPVKSTAPNGKTRTKDKYRVVYSEPQRIELEKEFLFSKYITIKRKAELSQVLSLSERQIKIWFQNRRAKERKSNRKQKSSSHAHQQENVSSTTKNLKNEYSDDEMDEDLDESIDDEDSSDAKSEKMDKKQKNKTTNNQQGLLCTIDKNHTAYTSYQPVQTFAQTSQYPQTTYNQYSPVNNYQNFYQPSYQAYQANFQPDYSNFTQNTDYNSQQLSNSQNFQFSNDYMINRSNSSVSSQQQPTVSNQSSNSIIQVLSQFQSI